MKNGVCPKCGGTDIRWDESRWSHRNWLIVRFMEWHPARARNYVCLACGYLENYVRPGDLETVARGWGRVGAPKLARQANLE